MSSDQYLSQEPAVVSPEAVESMRFYLWILADRALADGLKHKVAPSDVVQQTMLEAHRDASNFVGETRAELRAWLRSILIHNVRNVERSLFTDKRSISREANGADAVWLISASDKSPSSMVAFDEEFALLERALANLPEDQRRAIEYRSFGQMSFGEVGERLERSAEAARKLWFRAVLALQSNMAKLK